MPLIEGTLGCYPVLRCPSSADVPAVRTTMTRSRKNQQSSKREISSSALYLGWHQEAYLPYDPDQLALGECDRQAVVYVRLRR